MDPTTGDRFKNELGQYVTYVNDTNSTSVLIQTNNTIRLDKAKTWFLGVNFFYIDKQQIELGMLRGLSSLDLSIKKNWNDWTFALNVNDVLRTNIVEIDDYQSNGNYNYIHQNQYKRTFTVSLTYNFGNKN